MFNSLKGRMFQVGSYKHTNTICPLFFNFTRRGGGDGAVTGTRRSGGHQYSGLAT